jgi:hypothetical protein
MYERLDSGGRSGRTFTPQNFHSAVSPAGADSLRNRFDQLRELPWTDCVEILQDHLQSRILWAAMELAETILDDVDSGNALRHVFMVKAFETLSDLSARLDESAEGGKSETLLTEAFIGLALIDEAIGCYVKDFQAPECSSESVEGGEK